MKPGDKLNLTISDIDDQGHGLGLLDELQIHIEGVLPGEQVLAVVRHISPHQKQGVRHVWAEALEIKTTSTDRVQTACLAYGQCGGCVLQHWRYASQVLWKTNKLLEIFQDSPILQGALVDECVPSPSPLAYRNQGKYVYGRVHSGKLALGAYAPRSHQLVDLQGCKLVETNLEHTASLILDLLVAFGIEPYNEQSRKGDLRFVILRTNALGQCLVTLVTSSATVTQTQQLAAAIMRGNPAVVGVVQNINPTTGNAIFGPEETCLAGENVLIDHLGSAKVFLASKAFFQLNRFVAELAYQHIATAASSLGSDLRIVDAYAGVGSIAQSLAPHAREIIAIESNTASTRAGTLAAQKAGLTQIRFITADTALGLAQIDTADLVVLNPPRAGCSLEALAETARLKPRLIAYLSCNPKTLRRDLEIMAQHGFKTERLTPFDMLPHTEHIETLALLSQGTIVL